MTSWLARHPGGPRLIRHYAGEDATVRARSVIHYELSCALQRNKYIYLQGPLLIVANVWEGLLALSDNRVYNFILTVYMQPKALNSNRYTHTNLILI